MILIVTLNLFVHKTVVVDGMEINSINHIQDHRLVVGESAIYSALVIKILQGEPYVLGIAGGIAGRFIKNFMDKNRIKSDLLWKECETRSDMKIIDSVHMTETTLVDDNFNFDEQDIKHFKHKFNHNLKDVNTVLINNKPISDGNSNKPIEELITISKAHNQKVIVSLYEAELRKSLELSPYAVVLEQADLSELDIEDIEDENNLLESLRYIAVNNRIKYIIYDNNRNKNLFVISKNKICSAKYGKFAKDMEDIGSKDLIAGALALGVSRKYEMERIAKLLAAVKGAARVSEYPKICQRKIIDELYNKIKLINVYNNNDEK